MKMRMFVGLFGLAVLIFTSSRTDAQSGDGTLEKIEKSLQDYQDFSALGRSGSAFIDATTISSFKNLFELDANLFWDLFQSESHRVNYLLTVDEYVDSVQHFYAGRKPVISFGKHTIELNANGTTAVAFLRKTLNMPATGDSLAFKLKKTVLNLRILFNIRNDTVLIQNITEDTRLTRIRSLGAEGCYYFANKISGGFLVDPVSSVYPGPPGGYEIGHLSGYHAGINIDIRLNRKNLNGFLVSVGLLWSSTRMTVNITGYAGTYRQSFDPGENSFEASVFDRAPSVTEQITLSGLSIPVTAKWYVTRRIYLEAGPRFSILSGTSQVSYDLSHTGGGRYILLREASLPPDEQTWFYLDEQHEMDDAQYGFFRSREFSYSSSISLATLQVSAGLGIGFEARLGKMLIGIEPWLNLGITTLTGTSGEAGYVLYPESAYNSFLLTCSSPRLNSAGIKLIIGKMFYR
jgi:hypothetical protein